MKNANRHNQWKISRIGQIGRIRRIAALFAILLLPSSFLPSAAAADNFTLSGNYNYTLDGATETKSWNIVQTPTNEPFIKLVTTLTTNGALINVGTVTSPGYLWGKILSTNTAYFLRVGVIENSTTNFMDQLYGNSSGGDFRIGPIASTNLFVIPNTNGVKFEHALFSR